MDTLKEKGMPGRLIVLLGRRAAEGEEFQPASVAERYCPCVRGVEVENCEALDGSAAQTMATG